MPEIEELPINVTVDGVGYNADWAHENGQDAFVKQHALDHVYPKLDAGAKATKLKAVYTEVIKGREEELKSQAPIVPEKPAVVVPATNSVPLQK